MKLLTLLTFATAPVIGAALAGVAGTGENSPRALGDPGAQGAAASRRIQVPIPDQSTEGNRVLGPAHTDPFFSAPKPAPRPVMVAAPPAPVIVAPAPPPAPPFPYRFVGRVIGPDSEPVVYLAKDDRLIPVRGKRDLGDGYQVLEFTDRHLVVLHDASQQKNTIEFGGNSESRNAQ